MYVLDDVDVLAVENGVSAPFCTRLLGDMGANVVKVERPGVGDVNRTWDTAVNGLSSAHVWVNRNKKSIELDLKSAEGRSIFRDLASDADVVVQNFSPGVVEDLGIDYDTLSADNEGLIYVNVSGYGQDGPYSDRKAYDLVMQSESGLISMTGTEESPAKIPLSIADINAAMYATIATLLALYHRTQSGEGQELDITMFGGIVSWLGYFPLKYWHNDEEPERMGMRHHLLTPYGPHETSDGEYVNFAVLSPAHWETFCEDVIECPELLEDDRFETNEKRIDHREAFERVVEDEFASEPKSHWEQRLDDAGLPWGDLNDLADVLSHPQLEHLDLVRTLDTDHGRIKFVDNPIDGNAISSRRDPMPDVGEHTEEVLRQCGYSPAEIDALDRDDVI